MESRTMEITQALVDKVVQLSLVASDAILSVYHLAGEDEAALNVTAKSDDSPVTAADLAAHKVIIAGLQSLTPDIPILSEEADVPAFAERQSWERYWIIDPLDGTKEFINRNDEFTVNIALIEAGRPVFGVVTMPVTRTVYWGAKTLGAYKVEHESGQGNVSAIKVRTVNSRIDQQQAIEIVASRRHGNEAMVTLAESLSQHFASVDYKSMGSSLKLCLVAEGQADIYPRLALTCEWDTAAAQAVVEAAGGVVVDDQFQRLDYNTKDSLLNPFFFVLGDPAYDWSSLLMPDSI